MKIRYGKMGVTIFKFLSVFYGIQKRSQSERVSGGNQWEKKTRDCVCGWMALHYQMKRFRYHQKKDIVHSANVWCIEENRSQQYEKNFFLFFLFLNFPSSGRNYFTCLLLYEIKYIRSYCIALYYGWICFLKNCFICLINWIKYSYYDIDVK